MGQDKTAKGAFKLHTLLDYDGNLPAYVNITNGKTADNKGAYDVPLHKGSIIVADRFYNDLVLLNVWDSNGVFFVIRYKKNLQYTTVKENILPENRHKNILIDEIIELKTTKSQDSYPKNLRRVAVWDDKNEQTIEIITDQMYWTATPSVSFIKADGKLKSSSER